jgi:tellurite resistance protein TerA
MTTRLVMGENTLLNSRQLQTTIRLTPAVLPGIEVDVSAFLLTEQGKVEGDQGMVFYGQPNPLQGAIVLEKGKEEACFTLDLDRLPASIQRIALTATIDEQRCAFSSFASIALSIREAEGNVSVEIAIPTADKPETALIIAELYRRQGQWKCRSVGQGFVGGLPALAPHFGVEVSHPSKTSSEPKPILVSEAVVSKPAPSPELSPSLVSLSKVSLDKQRPSIDLEKRSEGFGEIRINLNWNQKKPAGGLFGKWLGGEASQAVDLDLGCLYELNNGQKGVVQALGHCFGDFDTSPFIQLMGDDRTGAQHDGEWLRVNGRYWSKVRRLLIFAFIYRGVPNWSATDAVVTLYVPGEPDIQVALTEGQSERRMCGIALLENRGGAIHVARELCYVGHHAALDERYAWGLRWKAGSK